MEPRRLIYDISSLVRWTGPSVGIHRTDHALATWLRAHRPDAVFVIFDPWRQAFRAVAPAWIDALLGGDAAIDLRDMPAARPDRPRRIDRLPAALRPAALWLLQSRRQLVRALERRRIKTRRPAARARIERWQDRMMSRRERATYFTPQGHRRTVLPYASVVGADLVPGAGDVLISAGAGWTHLNIDRIRDLKARGNVRFVLMCYDIIPLQFPQFYKEPDVRNFREYFHGAFPVADLVIFSARRIESDARDYCRAHGLAINETAVVPLGADGARVAQKAPLPARLAAGRFAMFVSTIEPRKGHALLYRTWRRLLNEGVPQAAHFKLVFVGRRGWMVDDLLAQIAADSAVQDSLVIMSDVEDGTLAALYEGAAFCLYPSLYEGFGLPVVEALSRGKAVIASTGGALPEVAGEFSPCLDPTDDDAWYALLKRWIAEPDARQPYEQAIRTRYSPPTWEDAAQGFFRAAQT